MQKIIFLFLLVFAAGLATAQTTPSAKPLAPAYAPATCCDVAAAPESPCLEERPEWTATAEAQTKQCQRSAARVQVVAGGPHWPVFLDLRTDDVFALVYVEGKGYHRVPLPDPTLAKAD